MRVLFLSNIPAPYTVERLNALTKIPDIDVSAAFLERTHFDRAWAVDEVSWCFPARYLGVGPGATIRAARLVSREKPDVLWTLYERLEFLAAMAACRARRGKVVIHVMKTFDWWGQRRWYREQAKRLLFPHVFSHAPGPDARAYAESYGANPERIFILPEAVDVSHYAAGAATARARGDSLGEGTRFVYVGRLVRMKGIDYLLDAFARLRDRGVTASLVLVGNGVDEDRLRRRAATIDGVSFLGFVDKPDLPRVYGAADVLVFPTLGDTYGYVVEEAMAAGLPVITTAAVAEISERLIHGVAGLVVPARDATSLEAAMLQLATDSALRRQMGQAAAQLVATRTVDWWANGFAALLSEVSAAR
jgi:glycosyltransferase involved in cell wall biosynthesis